MIWKEHPDGVIIFSHHHPYKDGSAEAIKDLLLGLFNTSHWIFTGDINVSALLGPAQEVRKRLYRR